MSTRSLKCHTVTANISCISGMAPFLQPLLHRSALMASETNSKVAAAKQGEQQPTVKEPCTKRHQCQQEHNAPLFYGYQHQRAAAPL